MDFPVDFPVGVPVGVQNQCFFAHMGSSVTNVFVVFIMGVVKY